jgi:hypothetical protein
MLGLVMMMGAGRRGRVIVPATFDMGGGGHHRREEKEQQRCETHISRSSRWSWEYDCEERACLNRKNLFQFLYLLRDLEFSQVCQYFLTACMQTAAFGSSSSGGD